MNKLQKQIRIKQLVDKKGIFKILALDHISTLRKALLKLCGIENVTENELLEIKKLIIKVLGSEFSGLLLDFNSYTKCKNHIPKNIGTLIKLEKDWQVRGKNGRERITKIFSDSSIADIAQLGASGVKLMLYYRPDASRETIEEQNKIAQQIGELCEKHEIVYCLEPLWYPLFDDELDGSEKAEFLLAKRRPIFVIDSLKEFTKSKYNVDLFKLEFPADLRYTKEYASGYFDGKRRKPLYDVAVVEDWCREIDKLTKVPWTVMSSGVSNNQFAKSLYISKIGNADGYICGQAIWKEALRAYPNLNLVKQNLIKESIVSIHRLNKILDNDHL